METQSGKSLHPLLWIAGLAVILFSGLGVAAMLGWIGNSAGKQAEPLPISRADKARAPERARAPAKIPVAALCLECGVVQSVHEVDTKGAGSGAGAVGGAVVGGVLGHQVGEGDGRKVAAVVGAVAGGLLGNEIEKQVKTSKSYDITVRFDDGAIRVISEAALPSWRVGDKVKVIAGVIHAA
jgi:outer membrane lipoprotein SlyB